MYIRPLIPQEREQLEAGLRSSEAFTLRRCQILLASARGQRPAQIAQQLGCATQSVRNAIHAFHRRGLASLSAQSRRPRRTRVVLDAGIAEQLRALLHERPRAFGKPRSTWTLRLAAEVCWERGLTPSQVSIETIRQALKRLGVSWRRAKRWITSPDPQYALKKKQRDRLIRLATQHADWVVGFGDESWWSRLAQPALHSWTAARPLRLIEQELPKGDPDPKALACYGLLRTDTNEVWLRFVEGRPVSHVTTAFLAWVCARLAREHKRVLALVWDNASWHISHEVRTWMRQHNQRVKREGGVRLLPCRLPVKSPWLNPIEPRWVHGKRAIIEPARLLTAAEVMARVCDYFEAEHVAPLTQKVA
jgi:transposase